MKITKTAARAELARRARSKDDPARRVFPARHIMEATKPELKAIIAAPARTRTRPPAQAPQAHTPTPRETPNAADRDIVGWLYIGTDEVGVIYA